MCSERLAGGHCEALVEPKWDNSRTSQEMEEN